MREGLFIRKNKNRWERIQEQLPSSPDDMATDFAQLIDDLAYAKTYYSSSKVTQYINSLAAKIYLTIYRNRKEESNRLLLFWKYDVPLAIRRHHKMIFFSFIVFIIFFSIGFFSSYNDPTFVREVLGNEYVNMTERNIDMGKPFGVYQDGNSFFMWFRIMVNNIMVSFIYFFKGIAFGVPSLASLGKESIRLGAFEQMFYVRGLGAKAVTTVLMHGLLELTGIIISCAAGVVMGKSYLFPGTFSRWKAFREGTKDGIKMIIGLVPVFVVAAFFEGFITRHYNMAAPLALLLLTVSALFIIWYFIFYPIQLTSRMLNTAK